MSFHVFDVKQRGGWRMEKEGEAVESNRTGTDKVEDDVGVKAAEERRQS